MSTFNCKRSDRSVSQHGHPLLLVNNYDPKPIHYRSKLLSTLNVPSSDFKDWRELASLCELTYYLLSFANEHKFNLLSFKTLCEADYQLINYHLLLLAFNRLLMLKNRPA